MHPAKVVARTTTHSIRTRLTATTTACLLMFGVATAILTTGIPSASAAEPLGDITVFEDPGSINTPADIMTTPDGNIWFVNDGDNSIGRVGPGGTFTRFEIGSGVYASTLAYGPDGNIWFTSHGDDSINRLLPDGTVTRFTDPKISKPWGLTTGADGALWFTDFSHPTIGRMTTDGTVTLYADVEIDSPSAIITGPGGTLWFTNSGGNSIGTVATDNTITLFSHPSIEFPDDITMGPDGAMWFTNGGNDSIGRISTDGTVSNYTDPSVSSPSGITVGPDGALWFTNEHDNSIGRITTDGAISAYTDPYVSVPYDITVGPDGALWFTNRGNRTLGSITTTGVISRHQDPHFSGPHGITSGVGGDLWFANMWSHTIGRMGTDGTLTNYAHPSISQPMHITPGPDGNMWFTDDDDPAISRVAPDGTITRFSNPSMSSAGGITAGADGALWFTMTMAKSIGRLTVDGVLTTFSSPLIGYPKAIAAGPDGNLWFTDTPKKSIGRITPDGTITMFSDPSISYPHSITTGPDGDLWFTDYWNGSIGRITPSGDITSYTDATTRLPMDITTGPDDNIWFTNSNPEVVRFTLDGGFSAHTLPPLTSPSGITTGTDGNIWVSDSYRDSIVRIGTGLPDPTLPDRPAKPNAAAGDASTTITWTAPPSGGSPITGYTVRAVEDTSKTCTTTGALTCTVTGLTNGTAYTFQVRATNAVGNSTWSPASDAVTPTDAPPAGSTYYHPMAPTRLIDPRPTWKVGPFSTPWNQAREREVQVTGEKGIPADARAVVLNVTVTDVTAPGGTFISVYPKGGTRPNVSSLNASYGQTIANSVTTKIGTDGKITIYNEAGKANVIVDVAGYYTDTPGDGYTALSPVRVIDSRPAWQHGPYNTAWNAGQSRDVTIDTTNSGVPSGADAVVLNVTATDVTQPTFITVYPKGGDVPNASNLNLAADNTIANQVVVKLGSANQISIYNEAGSANVIVDVVGYYMAGSGDAFYPVTPERIIDPRPAWKVGPFNTPWGNKETRSVQITGSAGVPTGAKAVIMNVTATDVISPIGTFVTVFPGDTVPNASNLNASPGWTIANAATAKLSPTGKLSVYNEKPTANIIIDVNGYFG